MKTFKEILFESATLQEMKYKGHKIEVKASNGAFDVFVDGDEVDTGLKTKKEAEKSGKDFIELMLSEK